MLARVHIITLAALFAFAPVVLAKSVDHDGSTIEKAIPLKHRGLKAMEEQMQWMMKLHRYTPMLATRDQVQRSAAEAVRRFKAGKKAGESKSPGPWEHGTLDHNGQCCSYWSFQTPRGRKDVYFDTGVPIKKPGAVAQQEMDCVEYFKKYVETLKITI